MLRTIITIHTQKYFSFWIRSFNKWMKENGDGVAFAFVPKTEQAVPKTEQPPEPSFFPSTTNVKEEPLENTVR